MSYFEFLAAHGDRLIDGAIVTAEQTVLASLLAIATAIVFGVMRLSHHFAIRATAAVYIEILRGTSLIVQVYWFFFVMPLFGITLDGFIVGILAVGLNFGAYGAEVVRGAIQSIPRSQHDAALALSMSPFVRLRRIILPQALIVMLPSWGNLLIGLLKATALVSLISVADLMFEAKQINGSTFLSFEVFGSALIIYYFMSRIVITPGMRWLERVVSHHSSQT